MLHKILVALDNSKVNEQVFDKALSLAKTIHGKLLLLHVLSPLEGAYVTPLFLLSHSMYQNIPTQDVNHDMSQWEELKKERLQMLYSFSEKAKNVELETELALNLGDPGPVICEVARSWKAELIVAGRQSSGGVSEFFLGSVSNYVLHHAPCSVLAVQEPIYKHKALPQPKQCSLDVFGFWYKNQNDTKVIG
jgi:nucleotide-binding universal stress UspA family protein